LNSKDLKSLMMFQNSQKTIILPKAVSPETKFTRKVTFKKMRFVITTTKKNWKLMIIDNPAELELKIVFPLYDNSTPQTSLTACQRVIPKCPPSWMMNQYRKRHQERMTLETNIKSKS